MFWKWIFLSSIAVLSTIPAITAQLKFQGKPLPNVLALEQTEIARSLAYTALNQHTLRLSNTSSNFSECIQSIANLARNPRNVETYFDAAGKLPAGFLKGNIAWLGSFDTCQELPSAHYCLLSFKITIQEAKYENMLIPLKWGACFSSACESGDLYQIFKNISAFSNKNISIEYQSSSCPVKAKYTAGVIVTIVFCGFLLMLCLLGTVIDLFELQSCRLSSDLARETNSINSHVERRTSVQDEAEPFQSPPPLFHDNMSVNRLVLSDARKASRVSIILSGGCVDFLLCFSLVRNTSKIFSTNVPPIAITCINGIRVISMFWVILGHTILFMFSTLITENMKDMFEDAQKLSAMAVINAYFSVDSFFFLSGLLVAYTGMRKLEKNDGKMNWFIFYFHRYFRLTPSLAISILFFVKLQPLMTYAPLWKTQEDKFCSKYWWTNLLYINNFYPEQFDSECVEWTWYLANDMQFYVISPLMLILTYRYGCSGLIASAGSLLLVSTVSLASIYGAYNLDPTILSTFNQGNPFNSQQEEDFMNKVYIKPYCRIQPYLVGFFLGYLMHKSYSGSRKPSWILAGVCWLVAIATGIALVYGPHENVIPYGRRWSLAQKVIYGMFEKLAWGLALAWVVYACHYGFGGLVQRFLSARFWIPLSRLTYSAYLVHPIVLSYMFLGSKSSIFYSYSTFSYYFISAVVLAYAAAYILAVVIEFPCDNLENLVINSRRKRKRAS